MKTEASIPATRASQARAKSWNEIARRWRPSMSNSNTECMLAANCWVV
jgi:hypothetical protein